MTYDAWKTRHPDDDIDWGDPPEVWVGCDECGGEGSIEVYEGVSKWSIDPPCGRVMICQACDGAGGHIEEAS